MSPTQYSDCCFDGVLPPTTLTISPIGVSSARLPSIPATWSNNPVIDSFSRASFSWEIVSNSSNSRSEEHTSELQSLMRISYAVFCLKKKTYSRWIYVTVKHQLRDILHNYLLNLYNFITSRKIGNSTYIN